MFSKIIAGNSALIRNYAEIKNTGLSDISSFCTNTGSPWFDLTFIYPIKEKAFLRSLLDLQTDLKKVIGPGHFYQGLNSFHITFYCHFEDEVSISEKTKQQEQNTAFRIFKGFDFKPVTVDFSGGCIATKAIILAGFDNNQLNNDRKRLVEFGIENNYYSRQRLQAIYPNVTHISLVRLLEPIDAIQRARVNLILDNFHYSGLGLTNIGLYQINKFGVLSEDDLIAGKNFPD